MKKIYVIAAIAALVAGVMLYFYLGNLEEAAQVEIKYETVVVAAQDIAPYTVITETMVTEAQLPEGTRHPKAALSGVEVVGKMTDALILSGEQIITEKLKATGERADTMAYKVPEGMRALAIAVDDVSGIAGFIRLGDYVDVVAHVGTTHPNDKPHTPVNPDDNGTLQANGETRLEVASGGTTLLAAQNVEVLALERSLVQQLNEDGKEISEPYTLVTLAVTTEDAMRIIEGYRAGELSLILRATDDHETNDERPICSEELLLLPK